MNQAGFVDQYRALLLVQVAKARDGWLFHIAVPLLVALGLIWLRSRMGLGVAPSLERRFLAGAAVMTLIYATVNAVAHDLSRAKESGEVEWLATFPVSRYAVVAAYVTGPLLYSAPLSLATIFFGGAILDVDLAIRFQAVPIVAVLALVLSCIGVAVGLYVGPKLAVTLASAIPMLLFTLTPLLFPSDQLPSLLRPVGKVLPTTFGTDLLETAIYPGAGPVSRFAVAGLVLCAVLGLLMVARLPGWREGG